MTSKDNHSSYSGFGWDDDPPYCEFTPTGYQANINCNSTLEVKNFAFEIQIAFSSLLSNRISIYFRDNIETGYQFDFQSSGSYTFYVRGNNWFGSSISPVKVSDTLPNGVVGQSTIIAVVANGSSIDMYVDHNKIFSLNDGSTDYGSIGLSSLDNAIFSNAKLWTF